MSSAQNLLDRMREWSLKTPGALLPQRGGETWWTLHVETVQWFLHVDEQVENLADPNITEAWATVATKLRSTIFATSYPCSWGEPHEAETFLTNLELAVLAGVTAALNQTPLQAAVTKTPEYMRARDALLTLASNIESLDLPNQLRDYLLALIARIDQALSEFTITGTVSVQALTDQLIGAVLRVFGEGEAEESKSIRNLAKRLGRTMHHLLNAPLTTAIISGLALNTVSEITSGRE